MTLGWLVSRPDSQSTRMTLERASVFLCLLE